MKTYNKPAIKFLAMNTVSMIAASNPQEDETVISMPKGTGTVEKSDILSNKNNWDIN